MLLPVYILLLAGNCKNRNEHAGHANVFRIDSVTLQNRPANSIYHDVPVEPAIVLHFSRPVNKSDIQKMVQVKGGDRLPVPLNFQFENDGRSVVARAASPWLHLHKYTLSIERSLESSTGQALNAEINIQLFTSINPADKFPRLQDEQLLELVQRQTFTYFWEHAHPVSGMARERNTSGDIVTTGGSGFGIMAMLVAMHRKFISRSEGLSRINTIVTFLDTRAQKYHGAFPHWLNGASGKTITFDGNDNGGDLVETAFMMQGLLCARQYFNGANAAETALRNRINKLWKEVEWDWYQQNGQDVLYWHWSPQHGWQMNAMIEGWNECLVTYVLAAASPTHAVPASVYHKGWSRNGKMKNDAMYYGIQLPLGPAYGGPLFFEHYSFLGIDPRGLKDQYADYWTQAKNHTLINYMHSVKNPRNYYGYSDSCWGITASDNKSGYAAHEPAQDIGVISPTAALSSFPYTPEESMKALHYFYYRLGDSLWKDHGFVDAFNLSEPWFARSYLAIDQGPIIGMIENHRSGLLWKLFTSCDEVRAGMKKLGFEAPYLK
jgi:hypothetical protein